MPLPLLLRSKYDKISKEEIAKSIEDDQLDFIKICGKCEKVATHFCQTCNDNLCKFCIIDHYKNPDFTKDHEMIPI